MIREIIKINRKKCNGCGICVDACHEGAIGMVNGKAKLLRDDYCDGLGDCLPVCPTGAITFEERIAAPYNQATVDSRMAKSAKTTPSVSGCLGSDTRTIKRNPKPIATTPSHTDSQLMQWPVQIKLINVNAPYFDGASLLVAADCTAYAYGDFHGSFMKNKITIIGCPKLDEGDYSEKLTQILSQNDIRSITIVRMQVPCCAGIENAVFTALMNIEKMIPWQIITISPDGEVIQD